MNSKVFGKDSKITKGVLIVVRADPNSLVSFSVVSSIVRDRTLNTAYAPAESSSHVSQNVCFLLEPHKRFMYYETNSLRPISWNGMSNPCCRMNSGTL